MKKASRVALLFAGGLFAVLAVALLAVNLYVQSKGTQARIERELSERLGASLHIRRISVTPWWGLKLTGITMPQVDASAPGNFLQADTFRLRIRIASLFTRRLVIKEVSLVNPKVIWAQNKDGKWRVPASLGDEGEETAAQTSAPPPAAAPVAASNPPAPSKDRASPPVAAVETTTPSSFTPEVRRVNMTNGSFRFLDEKKKPVATFEGVRFRSSLRDATELRGDAGIARISLRDRFFLEELKSPLKYDPEELDFSEIHSRAAGGEITGRFTMRPGDAESPFAVMVKFRGLEADRIVTDAHGPPGMVHGKLEGSLEANGKTADPNALSGAGEIYLREGQVRQYSLLVALGQLLRINELQQLQLDEAHVKYHITPGLVTIDELVLNSPNIRLSAAGTVNFAGALQLEAQLAINERVRRQLFRAVRDNFKPVEPPGYAAVAFQVNGTVDRPKTNLMDKVVGRDLRDLGGVINSLLGGDKKERAKKKKEAVEADAPPPPDAVRASPPPEASAPAAPVPATEPSPSP